MSCLCIFQMLTVTYLCGPVLSARVDEPRHVTVVLGVNDTKKITFGCKFTRSDRYDAELQWSRGSVEVRPCIGGSLMAGNVCTSDHHSLGSTPKLILHFGKIVKGKSDGVFACNHYWYPGDPDKAVLRFSSNASVTVIDNRKTTVVPDSPTSGERRLNQSTVTIAITTLKVTSPDASTSPYGNRASADSSSGTPQSNEFVASSSNAHIIVIVITVSISTVVLVSALSLMIVFTRWRQRQFIPPPPNAVNVGSLPSSRTVQRTISNYSQWEFPRNRVQLVKEIGNGFFGAVFESLAFGIIAPNIWSKVAVKMVRVDDEASLRDEAKLLSDMGRCQHDNVVRLLGICSQGGPMWLIVEHAKHGSLRCYLRASRSIDCDTCPAESDSLITKHPIRLTEMKMFEMALQIARGMEYLTNRKVLHRDLAARNVLVFDGDVLKICDFGMARDVRYVDYYRRKTPGVLPVKWTAPEAIMDKLYTHASDVWSFGILLWEIATQGGSPYPGVPVERLYGMLTEGYRMSCPVACPRLFYGVMLSCWATKPSGRPSFSDLIAQIDDVLTEIDDLSLFVNTKAGEEESKCDSGIVRDGDL